MGHTSLPQVQHPWPASGRYTREAKNTQRKDRDKMAEKADVSGRRIRWWQDLSAGHLQPQHSSLAPDSQTRAPPAVDELWF